ncbi:MAG: sigma-70 family RNA polymerase sigma factor [Planctomycetota bacterium]
MDPRENSADEGDLDPQSPAGQTSLHVRRARDGDSQSLEWVVEKFSPLLLASARYRITPSLRRVCDAEDLVSEVWLVALPRLAELQARDERYTPVLLRFLSSTLVNKMNNLVRKHLRGKPKLQGPKSETDDPLSQVPAPVTGIVTRLSKQEERGSVLHALESLPDRDREIIVLRGIEQQPYRDIEALVGGDAKSLAVRYSRALEKLRRQLPESVYTELSDD